MSRQNNVIEAFYPSDEGAEYLAKNLNQREIPEWDYYMDHKGDIIVAGGSNAYHDKLHEILEFSATRDKLPITLLFIDQHNDECYSDSTEMFADIILEETPGKMDCSNFVKWIRNLDNVDQVIHLGISSNILKNRPSDSNPYALSDIIGEVFMYVAHTIAEHKLSPEYLIHQKPKDPITPKVINILNSAWEITKGNHDKSIIFPRPDEYQELEQKLKDNPTIAKYQYILDSIPHQYKVTWKKPDQFDPSIIRNENVWISLDYDVFDESAGVDTDTNFGTVPYKWFEGFIKSLDGVRIRGFDYWGYRQGTDEYDPIPTIREVHETVKERMHMNPI